MLNEKGMNGLLKASPEKRYKNFLNTVTDLEEVWMVSSDNGYVTYDLGGFIHLMLWPKKEFCEYDTTQNEMPVSMEIHEFLKKCKTLNDTMRLMVFPTSENAYVVNVSQLCSDIQEHLDEIE